MHVSWPKRSGPFATSSSLSDCGRGAPDPGADHGESRSCHLGGRRSNEQQTTSWSGARCTRRGKRDRLRCPAGACDEATARDVRRRARVRPEMGALGGRAEGGAMLDPRANRGAAQGRSVVSQRAFARGASGIANRSAISAEADGVDPDQSSASFSIARHRDSRIPFVCRPSPTRAFARVTVDGRSGSHLSVPRLYASSVITAYVRLRI